MVRLYITAIFNAVAMARLYATAIFNAVAIAATVANRHHQPPAVRTGGPCFSSILINQPIQVVEASDDHLQYVLGFSPHFGEDLHLNLSGEAHIRAYTDPRHQQCP